MLFSRTIYNEYTDIIKGSDKEGKKERKYAMPFKTSA